MPTRKPLEARVELNWRPGDDRSILMSEFWVPIAQNTADGAVIYADLRMMGDDQNNREFNFGFGYRDMVQAALVGHGIAGATLWFDRRFTDRGSEFNQVTVGGEWLAEDWDFRINGYIPLNDDETFIQSNPNGAGAGFAGTQLVVNTDQVVVEEALPGLDLEFGWRVPFLDHYTDSTRIFGAVYHFEGDEAEDVTGWRARIASDITPNITLGGRLQDDDARGTQGFLDLTIRFPFGKKKSYRKEGLYARLDESPERDIDIVSGEVLADDGFAKPLLNTATGAVQDVIHVDNTAAGGGDGSVETPFNTLAAAEAAAGAHDLIYVHRGDGTTTGQNAGITLAHEGQMLIGSGSALTFDGSRFSTSNGQNIVSGAMTLVAADPLGGPVITNAGDDGVRITVNDIYLAGFTVDGAAGDGITADYTTPENFSLNVENVVSVNNTDDGLDVRIANDGNLDLMVSDGAFNGNGNFGIFTFLRGNGSGTTDIRDNVLDMNGRSGYRLTSRDGYSQDSSLIGNVARMNTEYGFDLRAEGTEAGMFVMKSNTASSNTLSGYHLRLFTGDMQVLFESNVATNNTSNGVLINDDSPAEMVIDLGGGSLGSRGQNQIFGNGVFDIRVDLDGNTLKAEDNWWGSAAGLQPADLRLDDGSGIDADPFLTSAP